MSVDPSSRGWNEHRHRGIYDGDIGWLQVGSAGQPPYLNGFAVYGSGTWGPLKFRKLVSGLVVFVGLVTVPSPLPTLVNGPGIVAGTICQMPLGYRPGQYTLWAMPQNNGISRVDVYPDGTVTLTAEVKGGTQVGPGLWLSLNGIHYLAEG